MASGFTLAIPYDQLLLLVMALFMFVGATRGWYREFISTAVLISLTVFLLKPELAAPVVRYTAGFSRIVVAFLRSGFSLDLGRLADSVDQVTLPFDASNPYMLFVVSLALFVLLSYTTGGARSVSALSRLLGGLLGLFNGFLVVSLFKEYVVKYFQESLPEIAAASASPDVAVSVSGLPKGSLLTGGGSTLVVVLLALIAGVLLTSTVTGRPIGKR